MTNPIIFDLDNTLFDFDESERQSIRVLFQKLGVLNPSNEAALVETFLTENSKLWKRREKIGIEAVFDRTIASVFKKELQEIQFPDNGGSLYLECFEENVVLEEGAVSVLEILSKSHPLYVVSNGLKNIQKRRLLRSKLKDYFTDVVVSGDIGYAKPEREIFDHIIDRNGLCRDTVVYIGDSIRDDYYGSKNAGLKYIFYNRKRIKVTGIDCLQVCSLDELPSILKKI